MNDNRFRHRSLFSQPARREESHSSKRTGTLGPLLWRALVRTCTAIGAMVLLSALWGVMLAGALSEDTAPLPSEAVLYLPLGEDYSEHHDSSGIFASEAPTIRELVDIIGRAAKDERVKGIVAIANGGGYDLTHVEDLHNAIKNFRASGKFAYIYGTSYGHGGHGLSTYYLASAFDEIWMQPMGVVSIPGVQAEIPFFRKTLEKIGIQPQFFARKEYKNVFESITQETMSPQSREMTEAIIASITSHLVGEIVRDRGIPREEFLRRVDTALFPDQKAVDAKLVDRLGYLEQLETRIRKDVTGDEKDEKLEFVEFPRYINSVGIQDSGDGLQSAKDGVALVYASGTIMLGDADMGGDTPVGEEIADIIRELGDDEDVKVIVLRVNSPGGSPDAAEMIRYSVASAKAKGKKIIVSMGGAAASGGYWIAADADRIFASPLTMTGSIGVAGGKFVARDAFGKVGVTFESVSWGKNAGIWSFNEPYTEEGAARMNELMDSIYDGFVARVAEGRKMTVAQVDEIARGRVWTGAQAVSIGLVDELGSLDKALDHAATLVGAKDRHGISLDIYPEPENAIEQIAGLLSVQAKAAEGQSVLARAVEALKPMLAELSLARGSAVTAHETLRLQ